MKVLLINPPMFIQGQYGKRPVYPYCPPLGIAYIASFLRKRGYQVALADMSYWTHDQILKKLRQDNWNVVGISVLSEQRQGARYLCNIVRKECPGAFIVLGGAHPTLMTKQVVKHWDCDIVIIGEGEITMANLLDALEHNKLLDKICGIAFLNNEGSYIKTPIQPVIESLDELPFPSYEEFDLDSYRLYSVFNDFTSRRDSKESISIITSRGCIARCKFCSTFKVWRGGWRSRSPKHVVDEIEMLYKDYGKRIFNIADDLFTVNEDRVIGICQEIISRKLDIAWDCETRVTLVSPKMLRSMKHAGCYSIAYGVESVGNWVLERIKKGIRSEDVYNAFEWTKEAGIRSRAMLMVGNPGEDLSSIKATCEFIKKCKPDTIQVSITMIFPGTALYYMARKQGFIKDDFWLDDKPAPYNTFEYPLRTLKRWEDMILIAHAGGFEKVLRMLRSALEVYTGIRITKNWIDFYYRDKLLRRWLFPLHKKIVNAKSFSSTIAS